MFTNNELVLPFGSETLTGVHLTKHKNEEDNYGIRLYSSYTILA